MALRFQKRVSILPGVRLNFSRSGVSATIGMQGASVTVGGRGGPAANLGIPGSGLSMRVPLNRRSSPGAGQRSVPGDSPRGHPFPPTHKFQNTGPTAPPPLKEIGSAAIEALTTDSLIDLKQVMLEARRSYSAARIEAQSAAADLAAAERRTRSEIEKCDELERKLARFERSWFRGLRKRSIARTRAGISEAARRIDQAIANASEAAATNDAAEARCAELYLETDFELDGPAEAAWREAEARFQELAPIPVHMGHYRASPKEAWR